jgi:hypothetical protein
MSALPRLGAEGRSSHTDLFVSSRSESDGLARTYETLSIMTERLVPTADAAKAIGVGRSTLARWWNDGVVKPALVTPGGHARWDVDDVKRQLDELRRHDD